MDNTIVYKSQTDHTDNFLTKEINLNSLFSKHITIDYYIGMFQFLAFITKLKINHQFRVFANINVLIIDIFSFAESYLSSICINFESSKLVLYVGNNISEFLKSDVDLKFNMKQNFILEKSIENPHLKSLHSFLDVIRNYFTSLSINISR